MDDTTCSPSTRQHHPSRPQLPRELISLIIHHLDRPSVLALYKASRLFHDLAEYRVWEEIQISLPAHYGEFPTVYPKEHPHMAPFLVRWREWDRNKADAARAEDLRGNAAEAIAKGMLSADRQHWGAVRRLRIEPRKRALSAMIQIMRMVSQNLATLEVDPAVRYDEFRKRDGSDELIDAYEPGFERKCLECPMSFLALTTVRLGKHSIRNGQWLSTLCTMAPNLTSLDADLDHTLYDDLMSSVRTPKYPRDTAIRRLRLCFQVQRRKMEDAAAVSGMQSHIYSLLLSSPEIRQLSLICEDPSRVSYDIYDSLHEVVPRYRHLEDFYWPGEPVAIEFMAHCQVSEDDPDIPGMAKVRRVVMHAQHWREASQSIPAYPELEVVYFNPYNPPNTPRLDAFNPSPFSDPDIVRVMPSVFAARIRSAPKLYGIHYSAEPLSGSGIELFDQLDLIDTAEDLTVYIRSWRHEEEEVLQAEILFQYSPPGGKAPRDTPEPAWNYYTSFRGALVPSEIIEEMRVVEGASEIEWARRGVEVGDEAWKVLTDWKASSGVLVQV